MSQGFVYVLASPNTNFIKIGGTERPLSERLRAINGSVSYGDQGPWELSDFLQVTDWRLVEKGMHKHFDKARVRVRGDNAARELFDVPLYAARKRLQMTDVALRVGHERTERLFKTRDVKLFLYKLFEFSGLFGNLDIQGAWTLSLMPMGGSRWYTLNIGPHEVAFSRRSSAGGKFLHVLVLDRLILDYPETIIWIGKNGGEVEEAPYRSARERATAVRFWQDFANAERALGLPGVRRAVSAYWSEGLAGLRERNVKSSFARYHSYNAVSRLLEYKRAVEKAVHR